MGIALVGSVVLRGGIQILKLSLKIKNTSSPISNFDSFSSIGLLAGMSTMAIRDVSYSLCAHK
mgnify:CR=1 FL=1